MFYRSIYRVSVKRLPMHTKPLRGFLCPYQLYRGLYRVLNHLSPLSALTGLPRPLRGYSVKQPRKGNAKPFGL